VLAQAVVRAMDKSATLLATAAEGGDVEAQFALGLLHLLGRGVDRNLGEALKLFRLAADQGDEQSEILKGIAAEQLAREHIATRDRQDAAVAAIKDAKRRRKFPKPRIVKPR
jgi:uncharacterized protein